MQKILISQALLPLGTAVVYLLTLPFINDPREILFTLFICVLVYAFGVSCFLGTTRSAFVYIGWAAAFALLSGLTGITDGDSATISFLFVISTSVSGLFAVFTALIAKKDHKVRSSLLLLVIYNVFWITAIGNAAYYGITPEGLVMVLAAASLPITILMIEKLKQPNLPITEK